MAKGLEVRAEPPGKVCHVDAPTADDLPRAGASPLPALLVVVAVGGALGSLARYGLVLAAPHLATTLAINVVGSFLLAVLVAVGPKGYWSRPFLGSGVLGGFTTFSAFAVQAVDASLPTGIAYVAGTLVLGLGAAQLGLQVRR